MSVCVMTNDFAPFASASAPNQQTQNDVQEYSYIGNLSDDLFDSSFSFLNDAPLMENISNHSSPSTAMPPPQSNQQIKIEESVQPNLPFSVPSQQANCTPPSALNARGQATYNIPSVSSHTIQYPYPVYDASMAMMNQANYFHPYRHQTAQYNAHMTNSPQSPAMSCSPHGSLGSHRLSFGAPSAVSPNLVSPHSILSAQLSDASPSHGYGCPLPVTYNSTPLTSVTALANVSPSELPVSYNVPSSGPIRNRGGAGSRPKPATRHSTGGFTQDDNDDDLSDDDEEDIMAEGGALGLTSGKGARRVQPLTEAEKSRRRVVGEKMRRDRLRDAFNRVQAALPSGPLEGRDRSKNAVLDRATKHILRVQTENKALRKELDELKGKYSKLQAVLEEGFLAGAIARPSSNSPPSRH